MTYNNNNDDDDGVPHLRTTTETGNHDEDNIKGDYVKLGDCEVEEERLVGVIEGSSFCLWKWRGSVVWYWFKLALLFTCLGLLAAVFLKWVGPFFMDKELIPIINWETTTFSTPVLAILVFASVALFPSILLPSTPSMWVAGLTFGYGFGFLLIISASAVGVSLPYFIGSLFLHKIQGWLEKYPKKAAILRAAGEGNWFHQFRAVMFIRISPFPYILYNYCAVATNVKYGPYILGSLIGMVPEIFVAIYTGMLIGTLADASNDRHSLSAPQIVFNVIGFCATVAATIIFTAYAKRKLKVLQDEPQLA
ncbi:transmembrane protein 64 [Ricinus communis]|uniref:VTT domain-containing protein n=1 Tax=Ricinus communis TaxID=3988 RepID=B9RBV9_RICCO|nr:transmembrane protein 64 [Ricinus communis]EEF51030.1 conserved hypothetical protein [Ricinus communis]|eukprot:XP_002509643.1 transmembrane protein 64 [Ricinus communis]